MQWTDYTAENLWSWGTIPKLLDPARWQEWGAAVLGLGTLSGINLPNPYNFSDWQEWAQRFNQTFDSKLYG